MTIWYRGSRSENTQWTFSGDGGLLVSGRWHFMGTKAIYCSESIALCTLEWLAHHGLSVSGFKYYKYSINIPDGLVKHFKPRDLPVGWDSTPSIDASRDFAKKHLFNSDKAFAIAVPSVLVPEESNLIINPLHKDFYTVLQTVVNLGQYPS